MEGARDVSRTGATHDHLPALDGLRALSVTAVVAYHLDPSAIPGGYTGVDVFFVLSGFLITRLLLAERLETGALRLRSFYGRRVKRLFPGLAVLLGGLAIASLILPTVVNPVELRSDGLATLFYFANWHMLASNQQYFAQMTLPSPLLHTWSLAIEEQFYIVWPLALLGLTALAKRGGRDERATTRRLLVPVGVLALASVLAMALVYSGGHVDAAYYGTECRAFELLVGAFAAIWFRSRSASASASADADARPLSGRVWQVAGLALLAALAVAMVVPDLANGGSPSAFVFEGGLAVAVCGMAVVLLASTAPGPLRSALSLGPLRWLGRVSYEIYLFHWPVIVIGNQELPWGGLRRNGIEVAITLVLAAACYHLIDAPLRRADYGSLGRRLALPATLSVVGGLLVASVPLSSASAAPLRPTQLGRVPVPLVDASRSTKSVKSVFGVTLRPPIGKIDLGFQPSPTHRLRVMYVGDSVMYQLELAVGAALATTGDATTASNSGLLGWSPRFSTPTSVFTDAIKKTHPDIVVAMWSQDNVWVGTYGIAAYERKVLDPFLKVLMAPGNGVKGVVFVGQPPQPPKNSWMPDLHADVYDPKGMRLWEGAAINLAHRDPGRIAYVASTAMLEWKGKYSTWLPSPGGKLERVRQIDDFHLCLNGGVRYGAGASHQLSLLFGMPQPKPNWWLGSFASAERWYELPGYGFNQCPNDAPAHLPS